MAVILKVEINKIYLYPLGGISKFALPLNGSSIKELLILISGPLAQQLAKYILILIFPKEKEMIYLYHYGILIFNLLPIYPLDGGKLLNIVLTKLFPYKKSLKLSILISYTTIVIIFIINIKSIKTNAITMIIFLIIKVKSEQNKIDIIYEKFLLERYLKNYKFKKSKVINNSNKFYKENSHIIKENSQYFLEKEYLQKKYKKS